MHAAEVLLIAMAITYTVPYLILRIGASDCFAPLVVVQRCG